MSTLVDYEVVLRVRVQGESEADIPALVMEALGEHDVWPVEVYDPCTGEQLTVLEFDHHTGELVEA
jgi:hypothetical protein